MSTSITRRKAAASGSRKRKMFAVPSMAPCRRSQMPEAVSIPFTGEKGGWGSKRPEDGPEFVAAIECYWDEERKCHKPHSVFTVEQLTEAKREKWARWDKTRHIPRLAKDPDWSGADSWDFEYCGSSGRTVYHNSGSGGAPYTSPLCSAPRYRHRYPDQARFRGPSVIWWNPRITHYRDSGNLKHKGVKLSPAMLKFYGWRVLKRPPQLDAGGHFDPFSYSHRHISKSWYNPVHGTAQYCVLCKSHVQSDDNSELCEHIWENECKENGMLTGPGVDKSDEPGCACKSRRECRDRAR